MAKTQQWFSVDKQGLADLVAAKGKVFILHELLQNAWDCPAVREVEVIMVPVKGVPLVDLTVVDDDPDGFQDLAHAYTLFAPSEKKSDPGRRGRFNLGEKLVLSLCDSASISSTTGTVWFDRKGRHQSRIQRAAGTSFKAVVRMTRHEYDEVMESVRSIISPGHIVTIINGRVLEPHEEIDHFLTTLPTVVADSSGIMRDVALDVKVTLWKSRESEHPKIYEMGIPVVEFGDISIPWHVDVGQKVPLSMERDNVTPAYLRRLLAEVLNHMATSLNVEQASAPWVTSTLGSPWVQKQTVRDVVGRRFGPKAVIADPSDREGEHMAVAQGYTVVQGGSLPADVWERIKDAEILKPAGQVTPSPKPFSPDGKPLKLMDQNDLTPEIKAFEEFVREFALRVGGLNVESRFTLDRGWKFDAAYTHVPGSGEYGTITFNVGRLGVDWFGPCLSGSCT